MPRYAMVIDKERCVGCQSCIVACKSEWDVPAGGARTRVRPTGAHGEYPNLVSTFYVSQCNHCNHPTCVAACPSGATYQDAHGIVRVNKGVCIGCGSCVAACPYGARYIDSTKGVVDKCDFCASRVEEGLQPACVLTCPANAKTFGDLEESNGNFFNMVYRQGAHRMESTDMSIGPNVYYLGKPEHIALAATAFPVGRPHTVAAGRVWSAVAKKVVSLAVGATFLGQAVAFFHQLATGEKQFEE
jgi:Fe-S-cluster-containing dehydrogenase component